MNVMKLFGWKLFLASSAILISTPSLAVMHLQCSTGTACAGNATNCHSQQICWAIWEFDPLPPFTTDPIDGNPGVDVPRGPPDDNTDAATDCWKNVTINASSSSGFPYRNNGTTPHNGVDVVSGTANYGRGAPVGSLGAGYVKEVGVSDLNGNFVRVMQGDGNTVTYIHLLRYIVGVGDEVSVGTQLGEMNCTGNCGGAVGDPNRGKISQTHVHIQVKRTDNPSMFLDAMELYGGENCSVSPNGQPTPPGLPGQQCPFAAQRLVGSPGNSPQQRHCP